MSKIVYIITYKKIMEDIAVTESADYFNRLDLHWTSMLPLEEWLVDMSYKVVTISEEKFKSFNEGIYTSLVTPDFIGIFPIDEGGIHEKVLLIDSLDGEE